MLRSRYPTPVLKQSAGPLLALLLAACAGSPERGAPQRIVAVAPSVVETLFVLGLGDQVVGVGDDSHWPPEAQEKKRVGGFLSARPRTIQRLHPDLAILLTSEEELARDLDRLGIDVLTVGNDTLAEVEASFEAIATRCGVPERGAELAASWRRALAPPPVSPSPRVMLTVGRRPGDLSAVLVAGSGTYLQELLERLGATNAFADAPFPYSEVGWQEIVRSTPDVVIELQPTPADFGALERDWHGDLSTMTAVRRGCVQIVAGDHVLVPGPRLPRLLGEIRDAILPCLPTEE